MDRITWFGKTAKGALAALVVSALLFLGIAYFSVKDSPDAVLTRVNIVIPPYQDSLVMMFGKEKGWYEEEGLDVNFIVAGLEEVQEVLASGAADIAWSTMSNTMVASVRNDRLVYYYPLNTFDNGFALIARPNGPIKPLQYFLEDLASREDAVKAAAAQLKGKVVITTSYTDMEQGVAGAAQQGGLEFANDITIVNLPPNEGLAAFLSGEGDAYLGGIPQRTRAVDEGMIEVLSGLDLGSAPTNGLVTTKEYYTAHSDVLMRVLRVWFRTVTHTNEQIDDTGAFVIKVLNKNSAANFDLSDFRAAWNGLEHFVGSPAYAQDNIFDPLGANYWRKRWNDNNYYFYDIAKKIPEPVNPEGIFVAEEVQKQLILQSREQRSE